MWKDRPTAGTLPTRRPCAMTDAPTTPFHRVLLKLSGEVFGGGRIGLDPAVVSGIAKQIADAVRGGVEVAVVIGGGHFFRRAPLQQRGMGQARAGYLGIARTAIKSPPAPAFPQDGRTG